MSKLHSHKKITPKFGIVILSHDKHKIRNYQYQITSRWGHTTVFHSGYFISLSACVLDGCLKVYDMNMKA